MSEELPDRLGRLVDRYGGPLVLYARQWTASAEDVVQETFIKLVDLRPWPEPIEPWLFRVTRNAAISERRSFWRRKRREQAVSREDRSFVPRADSLDGQVASAALEQLPGELREIVVARLWGGLTFEQIAEVHATSLATVYRRYQAAIAALREILGASCPNTIHTTNR
ncbi:MAG: sigma-70 family RNA polymerase sigma factor [Pirellulales bacterium]|nr:sigma-70 family RNA polymerase sigma factor [Pirellulales bacterium]